MIQNHGDHFNQISNQPYRNLSTDSGCEIKDKVYTARPNLGIFFFNFSFLKLYEKSNHHHLDAIRYELGKEGKEGSKAVWENTGLIPKYYKPYS